METKEMERIIHKVKGLIALSNKNSNEEEAQSAFLMAQRLMLKHHLSMDEVADKEEQRDVLRNDVTIPKNLFWYEKVLSGIIAKNFRVETYMHAVKVNGRYKRKIIFMGFDEDLKLAKGMYILAFEAIESYSKKYIQSWYEEYQLPRSRKQTEFLKTSYIQGFLKGMKEKFKEQFEEMKEQYGLIVLTPKEVQDAMKKMSIKRTRISVSGRVDSNAYNQGSHDGSHIDYKRQTVGY